MPRRTRKRPIAAPSSTAWKPLLDSLRREWSAWIGGEYEQDDNSNDKQAANRRGRNRRQR